MNDYFNHHKELCRNNENMSLHNHKKVKGSKHLSFKVDDGDTSISIAIENRITYLMNNKRKENFKEIIRDKEKEKVNGNRIHRNNTRAHYKNKSEADIYSITSSSYYNNTNATSNNNNINKTLTQNYSKNDNNKKSKKKLLTPLFESKNKQTIDHKRSNTRNSNNIQKRICTSQCSFGKHKKESIYSSSSLMFEKKRGKSTDGKRRNVMSMEHINTVYGNEQNNHISIDRRTKRDSYKTIPYYDKKVQNRVLSPSSASRKKELIFVTQMSKKASTPCFGHSAISKNNVIKLTKMVSSRLASSNLIIDDTNIDIDTLITPITTTNTLTETKGYISVMLKKRTNSSIARGISYEKAQPNLIVFDKVISDKHKENTKNKEDHNDKENTKDNNTMIIIKAKTNIILAPKKQLHTSSNELKHHNNQIAMINNPLLTTNKKASSINITSNLNLNPTHYQRKVFDIASFSKTGFSGLGIHKENQDSFFIEKPKDPTSSSLHYLGICDGHGTNGHLVSKFITDNLPNLILTELTKQNLSLSLINSSSIKQILEENYLSLNTSLCNTLQIETEYSGSTCNTILFNHDMLTCANIGDSRAILGKVNSNGLWIYDVLSKDHKPNNPDESSRILRMGGRIEQFRETNGQLHGPMRVWLKNKQVPGLAMSRSMGDTIAASAGVISLPEIKNVVLREEDKFIIMGSDGVFDHMTNKECVEIVAKCYKKKDVIGAVDQLYKEAHKRWRRNEIIIDDITIIIVFFE